MRERAFTTAVIWVAAIFGINLLVNSLRYTEIIVNPNYVAPDLSGITNMADINQIMPYLYSYSPSTISQTVWAPSIWVIAAVILMAMIVVAAGVSTLAMWVGRGSEPSAAEHAKVKRHNHEREARIRRLLDTMDDEEIAALEAGEIGEDGERVTMETLLRRQ